MTFFVVINYWIAMKFIDLPSAGGKIGKNELGPPGQRKRVMHGYSLCCRRGDPRCKNPLFPTKSEGRLSRIWHGGYVIVTERRWRH